MSVKLKVLIAITVIILVLAIGFVCLKIYSDNHVLDKTGMINTEVSNSQTDDAEITIK